MIRHLGSPVQESCTPGSTGGVPRKGHVYQPVDKNLIERIKNCAYDIYIKSWQANKIRADTNGINRITRYNLQEEAILLCDELHACIGIAKMVYHLRKKRMKYWSGLIVEVRALLQAWKESDVKRYGLP